jgi:hypothetical protein
MRPASKTCPGRSHGVGLRTGLGQAFCKDTALQ